MSELTEFVTVVSAALGAATSAAIFVLDVIDRISEKKGISVMCPG